MNTVIRARLHGASVVRIALATLAAAAVARCPAQAAELVLFPSAIDRAVKTEVFDGEGRRVLSGDQRSCSYALLEQPSTSLLPGRVALRARLIARLGVNVNGSCVGSGDDFWVTVSGRPAIEGDLLRLVDLRLDEGNEAYRAPIEGLLSAVVADSLKINLRKELQAMLSSAGPYTTSLPVLAVQIVDTQAAGLTIRFDFRLEAR